MGVLAWKDAVDIGGNRGRLALEAAQSLWRVDAAMRSAFGRAADINEAWRSPEDADENYRRYIAHLNGGPWAPIALPGDRSVHCFGYALDTDDTSDARMRIWNDHGWYWTVYRNGKLAERWHLEYFRDLDNHRNDPAPAGGNATPLPKPPTEEEQIMGVKEDIVSDVAKTIEDKKIRSDAIVWVNGAAFMVDDAAGTKWNVARGQRTIEDAFAYIRWLTARGFTEYLNQPPYTLAGYRDITEEGDVRSEVAAALRDLEQEKIAEAKKAAEAQEAKS